MTTQGTSGFEQKKSRVSLLFRLASFWSFRAPSRLPPGQIRVSVRHDRLPARFLFPLSKIGNIFPGQDMQNVGKAGVIPQHAVFSAGKLELDEPAITEHNAARRSRTGYKRGQKKCGNRHVCIVPETLSGGSCQAHQFE